MTGHDDARGNEVGQELRRWRCEQEGELQGAPDGMLGGHERGWGRQTEGPALAQCEGRLSDECVVLVHMAQLRAVHCVFDLSNSDELHLLRRRAVHYPSCWRLRDSG